MRNRNEAQLGAVFFLMFGLRWNEGLVLATLTTSDYRTMGELQAVISRDNSAAPTGTVSNIIYLLRRKLAPHGLQVTTVPKLGFGLDQNSRDRIRERLARYDEGIIPTKKSA